ncbi:hypothetical protein OOT00_10970 [Desulfobotulus sp. H1]|uniref:Uncharacterized protein n=1 Tax=Desulfobotulus pelophilus TaxID=2823377 RepID=A0ABT3NAM0_9BACT|nr:hypothetical protein [Desulfobotulus pelophilus]MCW7754503.1 hypothetical protein [Desulfobotulus pelophilus]MCW7754506.1 hypothetical protein [Desulfobotulus pelophilus]
MDVKDYCKGTEMELTAWKAKLYDLTRKLDRLSAADKEKVTANVEDLHIIVAELEDRIHQLRFECPAEWAPVKDSIEKGHVDMRGRYEKTMEEIGRYAPVSIAG